MDPKFGIDNVSVVLLLNETSQEIELGAAVNYNVTASSSQDQVKIEYQERTKFQLVIQYNI